MVEVFIPPSPQPGVDPIRVFDDDDVRTLVGGFVGSDEGEVVMVAVGAERDLLAVVAFGSVELQRIADDPRPLVSIAVGSSCRSVMIGQLGVRADDVVDAARAIGAALAVDDIELECWVDL